MLLETRAKSFCQTMSQAYKSHSNDQTLDLKSFTFEIEKFLFDCRLLSDPLWFEGNPGLFLHDGNPP